MLPLDDEEDDVDEDDETLPLDDADDDTLPDEEDEDDTLPLDEDETLPELLLPPLAEEIKPDDPPEPPLAEEIDPDELDDVLPDEKPPVLDE
ncbi:hypothetical protein, partial [Escherichia coli]